jgi:nicotinamidase-related amidase
MYGLHHCVLFALRDLYAEGFKVFEVLGLLCFRISRSRDHSFNVSEGLRHPRIKVSRFSDFKVSMIKV